MLVLFPSFNYLLFKHLIKGNVAALANATKSKRKAVAQVKSTFILKIPYL
jgi:hypothetical protein